MSGKDSGLNRCLNEMKFDTRLVNFNIENGIVTREDYDEFLKTLADEADRSIALSLDSDTAAPAPATQEEEATPSTPTNSFF